MPFSRFRPSSTRVKLRDHDTGRVPEMRLDETSEAQRRLPGQGRRQRPGDAISPQQQLLQAQVLVGIPRQETRERFAVVPRSSDGAPSQAACP